MLKKFLLGLCSLFAIVVIVVVLFGGPLFDRAVRRGVTDYGPRLTETSISLGGVDISPWDGHGTLTDLIIGNPEGFEGDYAIRLPEASLEIKPRSLLSGPVVIERIYIGQPEINLETSGTTINLREIQRNVAEAVGGEDPQTDEQPGEGRKYIVEEFLLEGGRVSARQMNGEMAIPTVRVTDIGAAEGGVTADKVVQAILDAVLRETSGVLGGQAGRLLENPQEAIDAAESIRDRVSDWMGGGSE